MPTSEPSGATAKSFLLLAPCFLLHSYEMTFLFFIFAALALIGGIGVVAFKNPVSSAFSMVVSFLGLAALFIQLNAFLVGVLQILVYAGAIMVLFLFIIMLLESRVCCFKECFNHLSNRNAFIQINNTISVE